MSLTFKISNDDPTKAASIAAYVADGSMSKQMADGLRELITDEIDSDVTSDVSLSVEVVVTEAVA